MLDISWCTQCISNITNATQDQQEISNYIAANHDQAWLGIAIISVLSGILIAFYGYGIFYFTLGMAGFGAGFGIFFSILCGSTNEALWAVVAGCLGGIFLAWLVIRLEKYGVLLVGAGAGAIAYMYSNGFVLSHLYEALPEAHQSWLPAVLLSIMMMTGSYLAYAIERHLIIVATSFAGAYAVGFGVYRLAGGESHDLNPIVLFSGGGCSGPECYSELSLLVLLALAGVWVQYRHTSQDKYRNRASKQEEYTRSEYQEALQSPDAKVIIIQGNQRRVSREFVV